MWTIISTVFSTPGQAVVAPAWCICCCCRKPSIEKDYFVARIGTARRFGEVVQPVLSFLVLLEGGFCVAHMRHPRLQTAAACFCGVEESAAQLFRT